MGSGTLHGRLALAALQRTDYREVGTDMQGYFGRQRKLQDMERNIFEHSDGDRIRCVKLTPKNESFNQALPWHQMSKEVWYLLCTPSFTLDNLMGHSGHFIN